MSMEPRPVYLDVLRIRLPAMAVASFLHRVSGLVLFFSLPLALWLLQRSLADEEGFLWVRGLWQHPGVRLWAGTFLWALAHHALGGVRFLWMDAGLWDGLKAARASAWAVNAAAPLIALGVVLWS